MMPGPGYYWMGEEEKQEVLDVLSDKWLFRYGSDEDPAFKRKVAGFEDQVAAAFNVNHALAVTSGTTALIVALSAAGIGPGDEVIVPGYTFIASISSIVTARAVPILAEVDESLCIDPADVEKKITPRTKAIMAVHMLGRSCDLESLTAIARKHNLVLIEDAAQAFGGTYRGKRLGTVGDAGIYSFNIFKIINAGDGGMMVTNDESYYKRSFSYHDQGHLPSRSGAEIGNRSVIGQNFRMNELTGAVLLAQFRKLGMILERLRGIKKRFKDGITGLPGVEFVKLNDEAGDCGTFLTVLLPDAESAEQIANRLGTTTVSRSGWHVYNNMEQILEQKTANADGCPFTCPRYKSSVAYSRGMLPRTDELLGRAINISVGVIDPGIGAAFGASPMSDDSEVDQKILEFSSAVRATIS